MSSSQAYFVFSACLLLLAGAGARGDEGLFGMPPTGAPVLAEVRASSEKVIAGKRHGALQALDMNVATSWCPKDDDPNPELVITFAKPVALSTVEVFGGNEDLPDHLEIDAIAVHIFEPDVYVPAGGTDLAELAIPEHHHRFARPGVPDPRPVRRAESRG